MVRHQAWRMRAAVFGWVKTGCLVRSKYCTSVGVCGVSEPSLDEIVGLSDSSDTERVSSGRGAAGVAYRLCELLSSCD
eukprot:s6040_g4.t5